jgi:diacylglycerol O-acyltransferase / wax synthase
MGDTRPVAVELMRTLDEKFIANAIAFEAARPAAGFIAEGAALRRADGSLDRELIRQVIAGGSRRMPAMRQRLMQAPLGLTTPGWVPVDHLDLDFHVRFLDDVIDDADLAEVLAGRKNGEMRLDHPLWDFLVGESASGDVVVVGRVHHAFGDGIFGMRVFDALVADEPYDPGPVDESRPPIRAPRTGAGLLVVAGRTWWDAQYGPTGAWREYWRKPFRKRLSRWGGRMLRPIRNREITRRGLVRQHLPLWRSAFAAFDHSLVHRRARELGGSVTSLTVAIALEAVEELAGATGDPALLVPISRRVGSGGDERNHVRMVRVSRPAGTVLEDAVPLVQAAIERAAATGETGTADGGWSGYASYLPGRARPQYFGPSRVRRLTLWPVVDPKDDLAVFTSSYGGTLALAVTARPEVDVDDVVRRFALRFPVKEMVA